MLYSSKLYLVLGLGSALHATSTSARVIPRHVVPSSDVILPPLVQSAPISSPNLENNRDLSASHPGLQHRPAYNPTTVLLAPSHVVPLGDPEKTFFGAPPAVYNPEGPHHILTDSGNGFVLPEGWQKADWHATKNPKPVWVMNEAKAKPVARKPGDAGKLGDAGKPGDGGNTGDAGKLGDAGKPSANGLPPGAILPGYQPQPNASPPQPPAKPDSFSSSNPNPNTDHPSVQQSKPESKPESSNSHTGMMALLSDLADNGFHAPGKHDHKPVSKPTEAFGKPAQPHAKTDAEAHPITHMLDAWAEGANAGNEVAGAAGEDEGEGVQGHGHGGEAGGRGKDSKDGKDGKESGEGRMGDSGAGTGGKASDSIGGQGMGSGGNGMMGIGGTSFDGFGGEGPSGGGGGEGPSSDEGEGSSSSSGGDGSSGSGGGGGGGI
ncbi:hypothetical protein B0A48_09263 [Cryoendolithus antarcticus]|uniref:Uncharacterized protein n=1 Tax=Cryoendolithus antarcticus TaxID=1507870 RepID=A0A1V8T2G4_9PEZI|nr:hypothetical protein B0A48_09263 [Cryoendolithus antarcticus]